MTARKAAPLRPVAESERAAPKSMSILEAAESGDYLEELQAMRRRNANAMDDPKCAARDLAALMNRQMDIVREIEELRLARREGGDGSGSGSVTAEHWDESAI